MTVLGNGLFETGQHEEALSVEEAMLSTLRRIGASEEEMLPVRTNLAYTYARLGRNDEALAMQRQLHSSEIRINGPTQESTLIAALNLSTSLVDAGNFAEARAFTRDQMELARLSVGADHLTTLNFQWGYSRAFTLDRDASAEQLAEVVTILAKAVKTAEQVLGREHPNTGSIRRELALARLEIASRRGHAVTQTPRRPGG